MDPNLDPVPTQLPAPVPDRPSVSRPPFAWDDADASAPDEPDEDMSDVAIGPTPPELLEVVDLKRCEGDDRGNLIVWRQLSLPKRIARLHIALHINCGCRQLAEAESTDNKSTTGFGDGPLRGRAQTGIVDLGARPRLPKVADHRWVGSVHQGCELNPTGQWQNLVSGAVTPCKLRSGVS